MVGDSNIRTVIVGDPPSDFSEYRDNIVGASDFDGSNSSFGPDLIEFASASPRPLSRTGSRGSRGRRSRSVVCRNVVATRSRTNSPVAGASVAGTSDSGLHPEEYNVPRVRGRGRGRITTPRSNSDDGPASKRRKDASGIMEVETRTIVENGVEVTLPQRC